MFKVGDKVKFIGKTPPDKVVKNGKIYTVVGDCKYVPFVYISSDKPDICKGDYTDQELKQPFTFVKASDCELYVEPEIEFEVGKKYIVKASDYHKFKDEEIVTCIADENSNIPLFESEDYLQFVRASDIKGEYTEIKVGDTVKLRDDYKHSVRFKLLEEYEKREMSKNEGKVWKVSNIRTHNPYNTPCAENGTAKGTDYSGWSRFIIPIEFLEKVSDKRIFNKYEIIIAELLIGKMISQLPNKTKIKFIRNQNTIRVFQNNRLAGVADCESKDEFNESIGKMIALCKATNTEIPKFVYGNR